MFAVPSFFGYNTTFVSTPVATAATGVGETSFTANWDAFAGASYYLLDVSTSSSFSSFVGSYQNFVVLTTSQLVSGLTASTTYYYRLRAATGVDADAASFFSRVYTAGGALSYTEVSATETLVADLKANSLWTPMKAIYPMVGASAAACAQNLKSSSFTGTFTSGWTFASTGVTPNGTSAFMDTNFLESTNLTLNSEHISVYLRTNVSALSVDIGTEGVAGQSNIFPNFGGSYYPRVQANNGGIGVSYNTAAFFLANRVISTEIQGWRNTTKNTLTNASSGLSNTSICLSVLPQVGGTKSFFSTRQNAFASIGDGLTDTQASNLYTLVQAFNTTLGRQV